MTRNILRRCFAVAALAVVASAMGFYVYPTHPILVWSLLAVCWVCYRLALRARALFAERPR